jgi:hypothetical protein
MNVLKGLGIGCLVVLAVIGAFVLFLFVVCLVNPPNFGH